MQAKNQIILGIWVSSVAASGAAKEQMSREAWLAQKAEVAAKLEAQYQKFAGESVAATKKMPICGLYVGPKDASYKSLNFGRNGRVEVDATLVKSQNNYFFNGNKLIIHADTDYFFLQAIDANTLKGLGKWTKDVIYKRNKSAKCKALTQDGIARIRKTVCYHQGVSLQGNENIGGAMLQYEICCDKHHDPVSCNKFGFMAELKGQPEKMVAPYYRKSCEMGYGGGCSNLAAIKVKQGKKKEGIKLYRQACKEMKFFKACERLIDLEGF